ncbi:hypothetical protein E2C01_051117 [Portunus trituberculatus]|uniref:Uncharacterized protein n=1 Tax=Portunus trituberculatus TaxID=210409 RepID=A0A5B7GI78_PORTR|nr:hypothetical protein [Portunus trituberculatus]
MTHHTDPHSWRVTTRYTLAFVDVVGEDSTNNNINKRSGDVIWAMAAALILTPRDRGQQHADSNQSASSVGVTTSRYQRSRYKYWDYSWSFPMKSFITIQKAITNSTIRQIQWQLKRRLRMAELD